MTAPSWLSSYVESEMGRLAATDAQLGAWLREAGGIRLFASVEEEAFLRPDGTVRYHRDPTWATNSETVGWSEAKPKERYAALLLGSREDARLAELIPARPAGTANCKTCFGRGEVAVTRQEDGRAGGILCPDCGGLGWWSPALEREPIA